MAITRFVNTASTAGGDGTTNNTSGSTRAFATLLEAINSLPGTLTDQTTIFCDGSGGADTSAVDQTPWDFATSATNYLLITTTGTARHQGKWTTTGNAYRLEVTNANALYGNTSAHVRIDGLQVQVTVNDGDSYEGIKTTNANQTTGTVDMRVSSCIVRGVLTSGTLIGFHARPTGGATGSTEFWNCIAYDCSIGFQGEFVSTEFYNCTAIGVSGQFPFVSNATNGALCINCLGEGGDVTFVVGGAYAAGTKNNASSDGSAPGTSSRTGQTFTFVNAAGDDYHLAASDAGARGFGFTDPGSGLFADDIDGVTREGAWDIGADQVRPFVFTLPNRGKTRPRAFAPGLAR